MVKVFVLGATGLIGQEVATQLIRKGYDVYGLARTPEKASHLATLEIKPVIGNAQDPNTWKSVAETSDVIIEALADYTNLDTELVVLDAVTEIAKKNPNITLIYTNGLWRYGSMGAKPISEGDSIDSAPELMKQRNNNQKRYQELGGIVILPPTVYGGSGAHTAHYFRSIEKGEIDIYGGPEQLSTYIHYIDIASLYVLAIENRTSVRGQEFIAAAYTHKVVDVVKTLSEQIGKPVKINYVKPTNPYQECIGLSQNGSNQKARLLLGWQPTQPSIYDQGKRYFDSWKHLPINSNYLY
ncbi:hypothetical protein DFA_12027 [Cavenderia fasciculata]|uniref:NAD(P)-binding domain-containing protein n=1 Tax=Cavenderia fasciculata TaxID=261658 RepID=F4QFF6_CACFS|nr:uncharacterized protein DFA_12027 [Cavenderia fasciculata]EGG14257.1 hypothetical protein DFA_12027 [Cavenderia fasciculata]|eukprot:XP_004350966.1 hypothetical protein DFA_12027 [Cavenderia fasciculata]